jgi:hypothetical protein
VVSIRVYILVVITIILFSACAPASGVEILNEPTALPCDVEVSWDQAIEILHTGQVESVAQLHSLEVSFMLKNGCRITTVEPRIDDIVQELGKCDDSCGVTSFATE